MGAFVRGLALILVGGAAAAAAIYFFRPAAFSVAAVTSPPAEAVEPAPVPDDNLIGKQAQEWGIATCLDGVATLSQFLTQGMAANWLLTRGSNDANRELFAATIIGQETATGLRGVSHLYAAPVQNGGCNTAYESTLFVAATCAQMRESVFAGFTTPIDLGSEIAEAYTTSEGTSRLFLLPAGETGCVAVKSEIFY